MGKKYREPIKAAGSLGYLSMENKEELTEARQPKIQSKSHHRIGLVRMPLLVSPSQDAPSELPKLPLDHFAVLHHCPRL